MSGIRWTLVSAVTLWAACVSPKGATPDHEVTPTAEVLNVVDDSGDSSTGQSDVGAHPADTSLGLGDVFDAESVKPDGSADVEGLGDLMDTGPDVSEVGSSDVEHEDIGGADISPDVVPIPTELACDSGDVAWVRRTLPVLLGRGLAGSGELGLLSDIVQASSRDALLEIVMRDPAFSRRWGQWVMDELRVNRVGDKKHDECFEVRGLDSDGSLPPEALARHVRELGPEVPFSGGTFTMGDLLDSALSLDDLSPVWLAHLFAMMAKPVTGANVDELPMDIARRQDFGEIFEAVYLHRNVVCAGCHNSQWATTDHPDPALDRHWSYPALFEKAIYGHSGGAPEMAVYSVFRHLDVVGGTQQPWGLSDRCGTFAEPAEIPDDPAEIEAYFIQPLGQTASIWDVVAALRLGLDSLRESGTLTVHPSSFEVEGPEAFAWMLSRRIANRVWREVMGYPLTVVHYFPRNEAQFALLTGLTELLVAEQWSLKRLLATVLTHRGRLDGRSRSRIDAGASSSGQSGHELDPDASKRRALD